MAFAVRAAATWQSLRQAAWALRAWTARQVVVAVVASLAVGAVIGAATVLLPNPVFGREIPPVTWNYPVWALASVLTGMLLATYVRPVASAGPEPEGGAEGTSASAPFARSGSLGVAGTLLAWFAVGCPVCNKLALLALGYTGALTWYAPVQPYLGGAALLLSAVALVVRLRGQQSCPVLPASRALT